MGKLILSSGERTNKPFGFQSGGIRIYSIEELCFFLYHHVYLIEEEMIGEELFDWIELELKLPERASKLRVLKKQHADLKTLITVIMCSSDYYSEAEIKGMLKILDRSLGMSPMKRKWIKADNYLKNGQFLEAEAEYEKLLHAKAAIELSPEEYGDIYHNLAVVKANLTGLTEASKYFWQAFERNRKEESLKQYLYSLKLTHADQELLDKCSEYQVSSEVINHIMEELHAFEEQANSSKQMKDLYKIRELKEQQENEEYYKRVEEMIMSWKLKLRQL
ncbi:MAG: hypothetical protein QM644_14895 [Mobilitalea sp.]